VVVALLGSPEWPDADSPHLAPGRFDDVALLAVTAERDASVPPEAARRFHERLRARRTDDRRLRYVELEGAEHLMNGEQWERLMRETVEWLVRHLG
jgi:pimeloyl-ACP methyl ester carboxylesterase